MSQQMSEGSIECSGAKKQFYCSICQKNFYNQTRLTIHQRIHTNEKPYKCPYENCQKTFSQKSNLNRHLKIHKEEKNFECQICFQKFLTKWNLKSHLKKHIDKSLRVRLNCQICGKQYLLKKNLIQHMKSCHSNFNTTSKLEVKQTQELSAKKIMPMQSPQTYQQPIYANNFNVSANQTCYQKPDDIVDQYTLVDERINQPNFANKYAEFIAQNQQQVQPKIDLPRNFFADLQLHSNAFQQEQNPIQYLAPSQPLRQSNSYDELSYSTIINTFSNYDNIKFESNIQIF